MNMESYKEPHPYAEDEISLIDLWGVLLRRKMILLVVFGVCVASAVVMALLKNKQYLYATTLEIGSVTEEGNRSLIDKPETMLAKIQEGYITSVLSAHASTEPEVKVSTITVRVPKGSDLVVLEAKGKESDGETLKGLERQVIAMVKEDHARITEVVRRDMEANLEREKHKLEDFQEQQKMILSEVERNKVLSGLLERQINDVKALMADAISNRKGARGSAEDATSAMTLLMIDNEIDQNRKHLAELEERLYVKLPNESDKLQKALSDNTRTMNEARTTIDQLTFAIANIRDTRALIEPTRSLEPTGPAKRLIVILGAVLGLILGIFAVFIAEFLVKAREQLAVQGE